ncbi:ferrous iron transport protein B [Marivirga lumbricoides]|uniref:Ferrous iron transport protein B n=1 Tax=Marivirga lumbricoides TaxID=1046115 RepID=A0ABQ1M7A8_9BACT|nr:ferrous iron transport protein B [Marivirga lumbricoides]
MSYITETKKDLQQIALVGVPNVGKSTVFNHLTGLNQKVGNYPGVTVDKKIGYFKVSSDKKIKILDLPGTYSIFPRSEDEQVVFRVLNGFEKEGLPDAVLAVADTVNLERSLFFITQIMDLGIPVALVLNMEDLAEAHGIEVNTYQLYKQLGIPVVTSSARNKKGINAIEDTIRQNQFEKAPTFLQSGEIIPEKLIGDVKSLLGYELDYQALLAIKFVDEPNLLPQDKADVLKELVLENGIDIQNIQIQESNLRYKKIQSILDKCITRKDVRKIEITRKLDQVFLHRVWGYALFATLLFLIFQAIFSWASIPMDLIDLFFVEAGSKIRELLPAGALTDLVAEGLIPGIGGVAIFIPQIALLFGFLALLEDSGYMSRAVFLTDRIMRPFGLNGKSVVPLISGMACAIPAIMATRNIGNRKDRLITILVAPFMSCSARLPIYIILIGLVVPDQRFWIFNLQGLALMCMYLLGIAAALFSAVLMKLFIKIKDNGYLVVELPSYRMPRLKDVGLTMFEKSKTFVLEAGKVILAISVVLWVLASYGPADKMEQAEASVVLPENPTEEAMSDYENKVASKKLEASYAGILGKTIEPVIKPLGYDWKIGIALITSFAAREVFVSTIATLYSIGDEEESATIQDRLKKEVNSTTGQPVFNRATGFSLLIFYAFAMQCMSTIAVVYRETKGWKWPLVQTVYMTVLAYVSALVVYQLLS